MAEFFRTRAGTVVSEIIDGEAVIMHLGTGQYFSAQGTGAVVWGLLEQTADVDAVVAALVSWTGADVDEVSLAVSAFVDDAQAHLLGERAARSTSVAAEYVGARPTTWSTPRLEAFSDLEDLLLLDPIHDVVEAVGWPAQKPTV